MAISLTLYYHTPPWPLPPNLGWAWARDWLIASLHFSIVEQHLPANKTFAFLTAIVWLWKQPGDSELTVCCLGQKWRRGNWPQLPLRWNFKKTSLYPCHHHHPFSFYEYFNHTRITQESGYCDIPDISGLTLLVQYQNYGRKYGKIMNGGGGGRGIS